MEMKPKMFFSSAYESQEEKPGQAERRRKTVFIKSVKSTSF